MPQPPPLRSGWSTVVKGKQSPSIASKPSGKQPASSKAEKADRTMSDAATEVSQATSLGSQPSPSKTKHSSSEASSSSSSGASKDTVSVNSEQHAEPEKPADSKEADKAAASADEAKAGSSSSDATEVSFMVYTCEGGGAVLAHHTALGSVLSLREEVCFVELANCLLSRATAPQAQRSSQMLHPMPQTASASE